MKILFLDAYFMPEQISFTHLENDLISEFVHNGHSIEVICPTPTRGISGEIIEKYKKIKSEVIYDGNVKITRFSAPQEGKNPIIRAVRYFWCNLRTYQTGKKKHNFDLVFANSTPPTQGFIAGKVAKKLKVPFIYSLQDIFPDSLVNANMTSKGSLLYKIGRKVENSTYKRADKIVVISEGFKQNIMAKGVPEEKITVIPNWIDTEKIKPVNREDNKLFEEYNIDRNKFIVTYAGNFGASQGADIILKSAELLRDYTDILFVIFGGGSEFESAKNNARQNNLPNVIINHLLPEERISEVYSLGDVSLITCKRGAGKAALPSKTWSIMACDTPIIAAFDTDSDLADVLKKSGAGVCIEPENAESLAEAILKAKSRSLSFKSGREYVLKRADKRVCVEKHINVIDNL